MLSGGATRGAAGTELFLFILDFDGFKVFCLENLTAIQTFDVVDAVSPGNDLSMGVVASGLHKQRLDEIYSTHANGLVKPPGTKKGAKGAFAIG